MNSYACKFINRKTGAVAPEFYFDVNQIPNPRTDKERAENLKAIKQEVFNRSRLAAFPKQWRPVWREI